MTNGMRSPFGAILREVRRAQGISQAELAKRIADRFSSDPSVVELGVVSDRAIANIEAAKTSAAEFVRPRPETVRVLMMGLGIDPATERGQAMLRAANATQRREKSSVIPQDTRHQIPFVSNGREQQWQSLLLAWETAQTGQPQIRLLEGTAGLGKTRLIEEFCQATIAKRDDVLLAWGECSSGTAHIEPYLPWRRAISFALRVGAHDHPRTSRDDAIASILLASVNKLAGVLVDMQDLQNWMTMRAPDRLADLKRIREAWSPTNTMGRYDEFVLAIAAIAREMPLVVVLEDLHWADESSCSLLLHLQRHMRLQTDIPLLVIGTYRPSDLVLPGQRHPLLHVINEMHRQLENVVLSLESTVTTNEGHAFVEGLVAGYNLPDDDQHALIDMLHRRTHGHPLFTSELILRLVEIEALTRTDEGWVLDRDRIETSLPNRMRAVIDERIQRLPQAARTIVEAASVQGSPFSIEVLPGITGIAESEVELIVDRELIEQHRIFRLGHDGVATEYEFDHEIIAETVYESLSPHRRNSLHRRTAEAIIDHHRLNPLEAAPIAAYHYEQAGMLAEAAEQALLTSVSALAKLDHDLTLVWVDRSERLARAANDDVRNWSARVRRANVLRSMGALQEAASIGQEAIPQAHRLGDATLEADAHDVVALVAYDRGQLDEATDAWLHAIDLYERAGRKDRVSGTQSMLSHVACRMGRLDAAIRHAQAAWAAAPDATRDGLGAEALLAEGNAMLELGRYHDAIDIYTRSLGTFSFTGEMRGIILCRMNIALSHVLQGNIAYALDRFADLQRDMSRLQTPRLQAFVWLYQGKAFEANGDYAHAMNHYRHALETRHESGMVAMAGDDLAGMLRAAIGLNVNVASYLDALQSWWRSNDPRALEDPLLAMLSLVNAYEVLGNDRLMSITLNEGAKMFLNRAEQIQNPAIRDMYLRGNRTGRLLLERAQEAGLVER